MTSLENYLDPLFYSYFKRPIQQTLCYEVIQAGRVIKYSDKTVLISSDDEKWYEVAFKIQLLRFKKLS